VRYFIWAHAVYRMFVYVYVYDAALLILQACNEVLKLQCIQCDKKMIMSGEEIIAFAFACTTYSLGNLRSRLSYAQNTSLNP
jgi:hypothetical protein